MENALIPTSEEIKAIEVMSKHAFDSKYMDKLGGYAGIFSIAMYARELGIPIMAALFGGMTNVMGKITISPQLMNSMIRKAGHKLEIESSDIKCTIKGTRKDTGETCSATFSVEDAKKAGIFKTGGGWDKYPSDMCFARALSRLARRLFPDVIGTSYVEGEIKDEPIKHEKKESEKIVTLDVSSPDAVEIEVQEDCISDKDLLHVGELIGDDVEYIEKLRAHFKIDNLEFIPASQVPALLGRLKERKEKLKEAK